METAHWLEEHLLKHSAFLSFHPSQTHCHTCSPCPWNAPSRRYKGNVVCVGNASFKDSRFKWSLDHQDNEQRISAGWGHSILWKNKKSTIQRKSGSLYGSMSTCYTKHSFSSMFTNQDAKVFQVHQSTPQKAATAPPPNRQGQTCSPPRMQTCSKHAFLCRFVQYAWMDDPLFTSLYAISIGTRIGSQKLRNIKNSARLAFYSLINQIRYSDIPTMDFPNNFDLISIQNQSLV